MKMTILVIAIFVAEDYVCLRSETASKTATPYCRGTYECKCPINIYTKQRNLFRLQSMI